MANAQTPLLPSLPTGDTLFTVWAQACSLSQYNYPLSTSKQLKAGISLLLNQQRKKLGILATKIMNSIVGILGLIVGVVGLIIAWFQYKDKLKLEQFSKATLRGMAGNIAKIQQSTAWARTNIRDANNSAIRLPDSELKLQLLTFISNGMGDATASDRLITNLFNDVLNMQEAQFKTRTVTHPERDELNLYKKEQDQLAISSSNV